MQEIYFNNREGQTVLSEAERRGIKFKHISSIAELNQLEQMNVNEGLLWLKSYRGDYLHDSFFRKLHLKLFGDVWNWAGKYRLSEKNIGITPWKVPANINKLCDDVEFWLKNDSYSREELLARFHHRLVYIHPFPNGNGRFSRIITGYLCIREKIKTPTWHCAMPATEKRKKYIKCLQAADMKDFEPLIKYFKEDQLKLYSKF